MREIMQNILRVFYNPRIVFDEIGKKKQSIFPLFTVSLIITAISSIGVIYLNNKANDIISSGIANDYGNIERIEQIATTQTAPYIVSLFITAAFSILFVALVMFAISRLFKYDSLLIDVINIVTYSWCPMIISNLVTVVLMFVVPLNKSFGATALVDYIVDKDAVGEVMYNIMSNVDPMYIWFLILLAYGLGIVYSKKKYKWYIATAIVWLLPIALNILSTL